MERIIWFHMCTNIDTLPRMKCEDFHKPHHMSMILDGMFSDNLELPDLELLDTIHEYLSAV